MCANVSDRRLGMGCASMLELSKVSRGFEPRLLDSESRVQDGSGSMISDAQSKQATYETFTANSCLSLNHTCSFESMLEPSGHGSN